MDQFHSNQLQISDFSAGEQEPGSYSILQRQYSEHIWILMYGMDQAYCQLRKCSTLVWITEEVIKWGGRCQYSTNQLINNKKEETCF